MKKIILVLATLIATTSGQASYEVFESEVYPILRTRCSNCHSDYMQFPLHSDSNPRTAYSEAKKLINRNFPDQSRLWERSQNNHCGRPKTCGFRQPELFDALETWIASEIKMEAEEAKKYVKVGSTTVRREEIKNFSQIAIPLDQARGSFIVSLEELSKDNYLMTEPRWQGLTQNLRFEGLEIRSNQFRFAHQRFDAPWVLKKANSDSKQTQMLKLRQLDEGYQVAIPNFESDSSTVEFELWLKQPVWNEPLDELIPLVRQKLYNFSVDQAHPDRIQGLSALAQGLCATLASGKVMCWSKSHKNGLTDETFEILGDEFFEMERVSETFDFSEIGGIKRIEYFEALDLTCVLTNNGLFGCSKNQDFLLKPLPLTFEDFETFPAEQNIVALKSFDLQTKQGLKQLTCLVYQSKENLCHIFPGENIQTVANFYSSLLEAQPLSVGIQNLSTSSSYGQYGIVFENGLQVDASDNDLAEILSGSADPEDLPGLSVNIKKYNSVSTGENFFDRRFFEFALDDEGTLYIRTHQISKVADDSLFNPIDFGSVSKVTDFKINPYEENICVLFDDHTSSCVMLTERSSLFDVWKVAQGFFDENGRIIVGDNPPIINFGTTQKVVAIHDFESTCFEFENQTFKCLQSSLISEKPVDFEGHFSELPFTIIDPTSRIKDRVILSSSLDNSNSTLGPISGVLFNLTNGKSKFYYYTNALGQYGLNSTEAVEKGAGRPYFRLNNYCFGSESWPCHQ